MRVRWSLVGALVCGLVAGCGILPGNTPPVTEEVWVVKTPIDRPPPVDPMEVLFESLSVDQKIGQLLMVALDVGGDVDGLVDLVSKGRVTGVLLLGNGWSVTDVSDASAALNKQAARQPVGLYIAVDQEGGVVQRLSGSGFSKIPAAKKQGTWSAAKLTTSARTWAEELRSAGVNLNFAPVADTVPSSMVSTNKPIGVLGRNFSTNPKVVSRQAAAFIEGMKAAGIQTCVKHFPGLGRVTGNTDFSSKGITDGTTKRNDSYVRAFAEAMEAGPDMVMMSLATYSKIDSKRPAVFSPKVINDLLRGELGWEGVVITDALNAAAVKSTAVGKRGVAFIKAGGDIAIIPGVSDLKKAAAGIKNEMEANEDFAAQVDAAVWRVLKAKAAAGLLSSELP